MAGEQWRQGTGIRSAGSGAAAARLAGCLYVSPPYFPCGHSFESAQAPFMFETFRFKRDQLLNISTKSTLVAELFVLELVVLYT